MKKYITAAILIAIIACMNIGCNKDNPSTTTDKDNPSTTTDKGNPSTTTDKDNPSTTTDKDNPSTSKDIITIPSEFIPDNEWRKKVSDLDTERCVNDIISNSFDYKVLNKLSSNILNEELAISFIRDTSLTINTISNNKKDADLTFIATVFIKTVQNSEEVIYNQSKGKYRCDVENIARYQIKEYNGNDKSLPNVFKQFVKQYAKSEIEQLDTETIEFLSALSYIFMLQKAYINFIESSGYNTANESWPIQFHGNVPAADAQKIAQLLNQWNNAMNSHDANAIANTHTNDAMIRGKNYTIAAYSDKEAKAFAKHPDFQQSPANDVYATPLADKNGYHLIFDESFTQGGKSTPTEIMLVVVRQGTDYKISYESDISTDRNLIKKMGINTYTSSADCKQLNGQIVMESPMFRHEYIPTESLSLLCEDDECSIGVGENGIVTEFYEFDHKAMKLIIKDAMSNKGTTYDINPKYESQIRKLCH